MNEVMTAEEIKSRFDSEWVLVGDPETEENLVVRRGTVLWHGKDREELNRKMEELSMPFSLAILYTGRVIPEGTEAILSVWEV